MQLHSDVFVALATIAWADGEVKPSEADALLAAARVCGVHGAELDAVATALRVRAELGTLAGLRLDPDARAFVYAIALWLAKVDGSVVDAERESVAHIAEQLGISEHERLLARSVRLLPGSGEADLHELARRIGEGLETAADGEAPLPPGTAGWPLVGETLALVKQPFAFVAERMARHGTVFRTHVMSRNTVVIAGVDAAELWLDRERLIRDGAMFDHMFGLFAGYSLPSLDGDAHRMRKALVMSAFGRQALESYLPALQRVVEAALARWTGQPGLDWIPELRVLAIEGIARNMLGMGRGPELDQLVADYETVTGGFAAIPIALPGTALYRANAARDRLLAFLRARIIECRAAPTRDGCSRMLTATAPDGSKLDDDAATLELYHVFLAGYIVFAQLAGVVMRLGDALESRGTLLHELAHAPAELGLAELDALPVLDRVVSETKRITPMLPLVFARAKATFVWKGHTIPAGWVVCFALREHHMLDELWPVPERFDPDRFGEAAVRARHPHAFAPQGPGPIEGHKCAGLDYATVFMKCFTVALMRGYRWKLPEQPREYDWRRLPPEPDGGLQVELDRHGTSAPV
jgi:retinoid hydroxylase